MFTKPIFVQSYRFSSEELDKMEWLKALFLANNFHFDPERFPEVYHDEYYKFNISQDRGQDNDGGPDYLGVYIPHYESDKTSCPVEKESKEGVIVLFKDRIEDYCMRNRMNEASVRFVVLMHELGHWLTHWAVYDAASTSNSRWIYGYSRYSSTRRTHEALAQLITYWAVLGNPVHENTLLELSPKAGGAVDPSTVYGGYISLVGIPKPDMVEKIGQLRMLWILNDKRMMEFLKSPGADIMVWINAHPDMPKAPADIYDKAWAEWIDDDLLEKLKEHQFELKFGFAQFLEPKNNRIPSCVDFYPLLAGKIYIPVITYEEAVGLIKGYTEDFINLYRFLKDEGKEDVFAKILNVYNILNPNDNLSLDDVKALSNLDELGFGFTNK